MLADINLHLESW